MNVAFRVDVSGQIGSGHLMRCLALANALKADGETTRFVCRHIPDSFGIEIEHFDHQLARVSGDVRIEGEHALAHSHWLGTSQFGDAAATLDVLADKVWSWLVVDHYALDARWESELRTVAERIMVIDDIADRTHDCDMLLDQNLYPNMRGRYSTRVPKNCQMMLGPNHALLREEFRQLRAKTTPRTGTVDRVLVFFGGMDAENYTSTAIRALGELKCFCPHVDIVIGAQHPAREKIEASCASSGYQCHVQTLRMAQLMARADLAIGAAGIASLERCSLGLPTLCVTLAGNQIEIAKALDAQGALIYLGTSADIDAERLAEAISIAIGDKARLAAMSLQAASLVDGEGTNRVCAALKRMT